MNKINILKMVLGAVGAVATIASQVIGDDKGKGNKVEDTKD
jgi:hypothetical protein